MTFFWHSIALVVWFAICFRVLGYYLDAAISGPPWLKWSSAVALVGLVVGMALLLGGCADGRALFDACRRGLCR